MREDFARLDELLAKDPDALTEAEDEEFARLAPLLVDPEYQEHVRARLEAAIAEVGPDVKGELLGPQPKDESGYLEVCPQCGQAIDARDLAEVLRHLQPGPQSD